MGFLWTITHDSGGAPMRLRFVTALIFLLTLSVAQGQTQRAGDNQADLEQMAARFLPTSLRVDVSSLSSGDRQALAKLIQAARIVDDIFLRQLWSGNVPLYQRLQKDKTSLGRARLHNFWINKGPWSDIDEYRAFLPGVPPRKPLGANFYPENMSKPDFESWVSSLGAEEQEQAKGFFTVIRNKQQEKKATAFVAVPYSDEYKDELTRAAALLREAAGLTDNASLKKFLETRADAFASNDYYESDMAWMDLDAPLDITIGPYETYNDELFGYKAAFEAYVNLRDNQESTKLAVFAKHLQDVENNLPIDPQYRNSKLGAAAPIRVVDEIISAGDGAHGVQTAAYNLPNDDRVVQQKGSKRVMLKNVQEAKFRAVLLPIARRTLSKDAMLDVNFESFFTHILAHELTHGIGPHQIKVGERETNPRLELKELYSAIEEAKADVTGLFALQYLMDHSKELILGGTLPSDDAAQRQLYVTFLASAFRSLRFGLNDAHGKGMAMQFNYLVDKGAFVPHGDGTFSVDMAKVKDAVKDLDHDLLTIEAQGDYAAAKKMLDELGVVRPVLKRTLARLQDIPTDVEPIFVTADELAPLTGRAQAGDPPSTLQERTIRKKRVAR
jgi:Peptidase family M49